jgi:hypothetical protein
VKDKDRKFSEFRRRMWLDYSDEQSSFGSITLAEEEYYKKYNKWLLAQYASYLNGE